MTRSVLAAVICLLAPKLYAETLLATFDYVGASAIAPSGSSVFQPFLSYGDPSLMPAFGFMNNVTLGTIDIIQGTVAELSGNLAEFNSLATNAIDNSIYVGFMTAGPGGSWQSISESALLSSAVNVPPDVGTPDFSPYVLTRIEVIASSFQTLPNAQMEVGLNFSVFGQRIPEPAGAAMALAACLTLAAARQR